MQEERDAASRPPQGSALSGPQIPALPLTPEAFLPFGQVIQGYSDIHAVPSPRTTRITGANQGSATKFHKLALLDSSYPAHAGATAGLSIYRCKPIETSAGGEWAVKLLERHPCTNQAFIPMGSGTGENALSDTASSYLVIVAQNGEDDKPDLSTMRAFIATAAQGIMYNTSIWRKSSKTSLSDVIDNTIVSKIILWLSWRRYVTPSPFETELQTKVVTVP